MATLLFSNRQYLIIFEVANGEIAIYFFGCRKERAFKI